MLKKTRPLHSFEEDPNIIAGRDLEGKGTWCGVNTHTKVIAFITNYDCEGFHDISDLKYGRGNLPYRFLSSSFATVDSMDKSIYAELENIINELPSYNAFNLIVGNLATSTFYYICNPYDAKKSITPTPYQLPLGRCYALTNTDLFDHSWPKVQTGLPRFQNIVTYMNEQQQNLHDNDDTTNDTIINQVNQLMRDTDHFSTEPQMEASIFRNEYFNSAMNKIRGTVSSSTILIDSFAKGLFIEHHFTHYNEHKYSQDSPLTTKRIL